MHNLSVRLRQLEYNRTQATVYNEDGLKIDQFVGDNPDDALAKARAEYKISVVGNADVYTSSNDGSFTDVDNAVREILAETDALRAAGKLLPFVEGTPIGTIPREHRADLKVQKRKGKKY